MTKAALGIGSNAFLKVQSFHVIRHGAERGVLILGPAVPLSEHTRFSQEMLFNPFFSSVPLGLGQSMLDLKTC
jgi:hypothetical protein